MDVDPCWTAETDEVHDVRTFRPGSPATWLRLALVTVAVAAAFVQGLAPVVLACGLTVLALDLLTARAVKRSTHSVPRQRLAVVLIFTAAAVAGAATAVQAGMPSGAPLLLLIPAFRAGETCGRRVAALCVLTSAAVGLGTAAAIGSVRAPRSPAWGRPWRPAGCSGVGWPCWPAWRARGPPPRARLRPRRGRIPPSPRPPARRRCCCAGWTRWPGRSTAASTPPRAPSCCSTRWTPPSRPGGAPCWSASATTLPCRWPCGAPTGCRGRTRHWTTRCWGGSGAPAGPSTARCRWTARAGRCWRRPCATRWATGSASWSSSGRPARASTTRTWRPCPRWSSGTAPTSTSR